MKILFFLTFMLLSSSGYAINFFKTRSNDQKEVNKFGLTKEETDKNAKKYIQFLSNKANVNFELIIDVYSLDTKTVENLDELEKAYNSSQGPKKSRIEIFEQLKNMYETFEEYYKGGHLDQLNSSKDVNEKLHINKDKMQEKSIDFKWKDELKRVAPKGISDSFYTDLYKKMKKYRKQAEYQDDEDAKLRVKKNDKKNSLVKALANIRLKDLPSDTNTCRILPGGIQTTKWRSTNHDDPWTIRGKKEDGEYMSEIRYKFYVVAKRFEKMPEADKVIFISYLLHFGEHCPDGKFNAIDAVYRLLANDDYNKMQKRIFDNLVTEEQKIRFISQKKKREVLFNMLEKNISNLLRKSPNEDLESARVCYYNAHAELIGLSKLNVGGFFKMGPNKGFLEDFLNKENNYSPSSLQSAIHNHRFFDEIRDQKIGFLGKVLEAGTQKSVEKKLINGMLQKHNFLMKEKGTLEKLVGHLFSK